MDPKNIMVLGVKHTVVAFQRETGQRLWTANLKSSLSGDFVTVVADDFRVYAHTSGEIFCLDLQTGQTLWTDGLAGFGYGVASIALPGLAVPVTATAERRRNDSAAAASASSTSASS
jgi:outer membrane protein assembly factor BamB